MGRSSEYSESLSKFKDRNRQLMRQIISASESEQESLMDKLIQEESESGSIGLSERLADNVAKFGGSWIFIICFMSASALWMLYNVISQDKFDPYPFILLNLALSCLAALQAPIILMSQNRQEDKDRKRAQDDYLINLKSELKSRGVDQKMDLLINEMFSELIEIQIKQIDKLDDLEQAVEGIERELKIDK